MLSTDPAVWEEKMLVESKTKEAVSEGQQGDKE